MSQFKQHEGRVSTSYGSNNHQTFHKGQITRARSQIKTTDIRTPVQIKPLCIAPVEPKVYRIQLMIDTLT